MDETATANETATVQKKGWWGRNWKWFVPVGCLSIVVIFVLFITMIVGAAFGMMKKSAPYQEAMTRAQASEIVQEALGTPLESGWMVSGNISTSGPEGDANLAIPVSGPQGSGTLYVVAKKRSGRWVYDSLELEIAEDGRRINLLQ